MQTGEARMIESIQLTNEQIACLSNPNADWCPLTPEQHDLVKTQGDDRKFAIIGDAFVRMSNVLFESMCEDAFDRAAREAVRSLGIGNDVDIAAIRCNGYKFGKSFITVTVTHVDGRAATAAGELVVPAVKH
jgi:hypothetical protein